MAAACNSSAAVCTLLNTFLNVIVNPLLLLLSAVGLLVFFWGVVEFLAGLNGIGDKKEDGRKHMLWGVVGMFIMFSAYAILGIISTTVGGPSF